MRRRAMLLALCGVVLAGCGLPRFGAPTPASEQGEDIFGLYRWFAAAAVGVGVFVTVLLVYVLVRFRRRDDTTVPAQTPYNIPIEVAYTVTPLVIVALLFFFSVRTEERVNALVDDPDLVVDVVGFQWQWQFTYPDTGIVVTGRPDALPQLVLPVGATTRLNLASTDVNHNFYVPRFLSKRDLIPGIDNAIDVTPTEVGTYEGVCAEFCGLDHGRMRFVLTVMTPDDFDDWVQEQTP